MSWSTSITPAELAVHDQSVIPAIPGAYVLACRLSQDLVVEEPLPPALHEGARKVGELLKEWYGWRPAELIAPLGEDAVGFGLIGRKLAPKNSPHGLFFTRGVDSWWTLLELQKDPSIESPTHLITLDNEVHVPESIRAQTILDTQACADRLGLTLITVRTDIRAAIDQHTDWGFHTHGSVLAGTGLALRNSLTSATIAPTHWTRYLRPWGSHPDLDGLWSLPGFEIRHFPGSLPRWQRVESIAKVPLVAETLQVCWQGVSMNNCGRCTKCLRLRTSLELCGVSDLFEQRFDAPFDRDLIDAITHEFPHPWCEIMDQCDSVGLGGDELRQRWEHVERRGLEGFVYEDRPVQPRIPVDAPNDESIDKLAIKLAELGARVDRLEREPSGPRIEVDEGDGNDLELRIVDGVETTHVVLSQLTSGDLESVLSALGHGLDELVTFNPNGQSPPPRQSRWAPSAATRPS